MTELRNIRRFDDDVRNTHAWLVQVQRGNKIETKMFSDCTYGGKRRALRAALKLRNELLAQELFEHQIWRRTLLRKNNTSGIPGVARYDQLANPRTGKRAVFWMASWIDEKGVGRKRKFSVFRYGEEEAKQLAIAEREKQLKRVCEIKSG